METAKIKQAVYDYLNETSYDIYEFTRVPKDSTFPYVVYNLGPSAEPLRDSVEDLDFTLEVDILDYREDKNTDTIESMLDTVNSRLNRAVIIKDGFVLQMIRSSILTQLPTPNENTFRRQIVSTMRYLERS